MLLQMDQFNNLKYILHKEENWNWQLLKIQIQFI